MMFGTDGRRALHAIVAAALLLVAAGERQGVQAQAPAVTPPANINGIWDRMGCVSNGVTCPFDVATLPLRARALGFREAFDEVLAPKYDCAAATLPSLISDPYRFQIDQQRDRVVITYEKDDVVRTVWLNGHGHREPAIGEFFQHGYSKGWYEKDQLVIETTKFTFDPNGLDDMANLPSSTAKKVIERYWRDGDIMRVDVTIEDPLFLTAPVKLTDTFQSSDRPLILPFGCEPELARQPLQFLPPKYMEPAFVRIPSSPFGEAPR